MGRLDKVNEQLRREIGGILQRDISDPRLQFVSITHVNVSKDLKYARVHFSVIGEKEQALIVEKVLEGARGMIRKLVGNRMAIRYTPELVFVHDDSLEHSSKIEETLKEIHDDEKHHQSPS